MGPGTDEDILDYWDTMALMWAFGKGVRRYGEWRKRNSETAAQRFSGMANSRLGRSCLDRSPVTRPRADPTAGRWLRPLLIQCFPARKRVVLDIRKALEREYASAPVPSLNAAALGCP